MLMLVRVRRPRPYADAMIHLVRPSVELLDAALAGDDVLARVIGHDVAPGWATFREALQPTRDAVAAAPLDFAWGTRFFVADGPRRLVGWGGFRGSPRDGVVELGYEIAVAERGRGFATQATFAMLAEAFAYDAVTTVIAHTLPELNASNRVLEKAGFVFDRPMSVDGESVWRFMLRPSG